MPYIDKKQVEFITAPFPKGSKKKLRKYAFDNGYRNVSEVIRAGVDVLTKQKEPINHV